MIVTRQLEDVFASNLGGWDIVCEIECSYEPPDKSVGLRGGWQIENIVVVKFIEFDNNGKKVRELDRQQMNDYEDHDIMLVTPACNCLDVIESLAEERIISDRDSILDEAAENAAADREAAMEARYEAMMEEKLFNPREYRDFF